MEARFQLALALRSQGRYRNAIDLLRQNADVLQGTLQQETFGMPAPRRSTSLAWRAWCLAQLGEFEEAVRHGIEGMQLAQASAIAFALPSAAIGLGGVHAQRGNLATAVTALEPALELCRTTDLPFFLGWVAAEFGWARALTGDPAHGVALLEEGVDHAEALNIMQELALRVTWLGEAYLLAGRVERAWASAARALELARRHGERGNEAWVLRLFGEIAARLDGGGVTAAESHYREAMALGGALEMRPLVAHWHLGLGKLYRRTSKRQEAQECLATATAMYREMDMTYWLEQAVETGRLA